MRGMSWLRSSSFAVLVVALGCAHLDNTYEADASVGDGGGDSVSGRGSHEEAASRPADAAPDVGRGTGGPTRDAMVAWDHDADTTDAGAPKPSSPGSSTPKPIDPEPSDAGVGGAGAKPKDSSVTGTRPPQPSDAGGSGSQSSNGGGSDAKAPNPGAPVPPDRLTLPPRNVGFDYQLGDVYTPPKGVQIVARDRNERPATGLYNVCYINGFQAQTNDEQFWLEQHPTLVLRDDDGEPIIDEDWEELMFDTSTAESRRALANIIGGWIEECARAGFNAVEIDNLDSYSRSLGRLSEEHAVEYMKLLSQIAHRHALAFAQKNASELVARRTEMGTDFAVAEECNHWDECDAYRRAYGDDVLIIEYAASDFQEGCSRYPQLSIVLRDKLLVAEGAPGYLYEGC